MLLSTKQTFRLLNLKSKWSRSRTKGRSTLPAPLSAVGCVRSSCISAEVINVLWDLSTRCADAQPRNEPTSPLLGVLCQELKFTHCCCALMATESNFISCSHLGTQLIYQFQEWSVNNTHVQILLRWMTRIIKMVFSMGDTTSTSS